MLFLATLITITLAFLSAFATAFILILRKNSKRIFGIYPIKGLCYYLKYPLARHFVRYWRRKLFEENKEHFNTEEYLQSLDKPQVLSNNPKSYDVVSFLGANKEGYKFMITIERRRRGITKAAFFFWIPNRGLFCSPKLPDMVYFTTNGKCESEGFEVGGFHIYPVDCMRRWKVTYDGEVKQSGKLYHLKFDGEFSSKIGYFDYNKDLSISVVADSISREVWDDQFFHMVKNVDGILNNRTHYEQCGRLEGTFQLGDDSKQSLQLQTIRDHSFGTERCLSNIYRYVYISLFLDNETTLVVGILSQPSFFLSSLKVGYICTRKTGYSPITSCNFELYSYGEKGTPPNHENFIVGTQERRYFVQIKAEDCALRYVGGDWESKVYNQFVSCTVDGVKGHGIVEFLYRNNTGRSNSVCQRDPEWYRRVKSFERSISNGEDPSDGVVW